MAPEEARDQEFRRWMEAGHCPRCGRERPLTARSATNDTDPTDDPSFMICADCGREELDEEPEWKTRGYWPAHFVRIKGT